MTRKIFWIQFFLLVFFVSHLSYATTESQKVIEEKAVIESGGGKIEKITSLDIGVELTKSEDQENPSGPSEKAGSEESAEEVVEETSEEKNKKRIKLAQEHYSQALTFYDEGEHEKAKEELKISLKIVVDLEMDIETLFRFGDVYKDIIGNGNGNGNVNGTNGLHDTTNGLGNIISEEKKIVENLNKAKVSYDIPVEFNKEVKSFIKKYMTQNKKYMTRRLARSTRYIAAIKEVFKEEGLPQDLAYIPLIESEFKERAYSRAGAAGIWQFMRNTGKKYKMVIDWSIDERYDPVIATRAAAKYYKDLYKIFDCWLLAEAAYNAGEFRILRAMGMAVSRDFWYLARKKMLPRETQRYVADFMANVIIAKNPEKYGFTDIEYDEPIVYDEVVIKNCLDLSMAAKLAGCSVKELKILNPALLRWCTPIGYPDYVLKVPKGKKEVFVANLAKLGTSTKIGWNQHIIKRGETMSAIAWRYGVPVRSIAKANNIKNANKIRVGTRLFIPYGKNFDKVPGGNLESDSGYQKVVHVVRKGDSLWQIGRRYKVSVRKIREWNKNFSDRNQIYPGERVSIWIR